MQDKRERVSEGDVRPWPDSSCTDSTAESYHPRPGLWVQPRRPTLVLPLVGSVRVQGGEPFPGGAPRSMRLGRAPCCLSLGGPGAGRRRLRDAAGLSGHLPTTP